MIKHLKGLEINSIYDFDNTFSINELLCKFWEKIEETINISNESIDILNWIKEEGLPDELQVLINQLVADGTIERMINVDKIEELRSLITNKITDVNEQLEQFENETNEQLEQFENETNEKLALKNELGTFLKIKKDNFIDTTNYTIDDYYNLYETLVNASRFDWINLGKDQSDTYDIRMYRYVPTSYNSTLFITCSVHGWEHYGAYIMYELFKMLLSDNELPLQLKELRNSRILCIPIVNPWGLMADNHSGYNAIRRGNSRGVDLNRNFDYRWEENDGNFGLSKGDAAFSEKETQYIKKVMDEYNITHFLDLHSFNNSSSESRDYLFYGNPESKKNTYQFTNWLYEIYPTANIEHTISENDSSANNYANRIKNIPSMNIELIKNRYGEDDSRRWLELIINYLSFQSQSYKSLYYNGIGCKFYQREPYTIQSTVPETWGKVDNLKFELNPITDGIVIVNGFMCVNVSDGDSTTTLTFSPSLSQENFYTTKPISARNKPYLRQSDGSMYIPFSCQMFVKKGGGKIIFEVDIIKEGVGTLTIMRSDATYMYIPTLANDYQLRQHNKV